MWGTKSPQARAARVAMGWMLLHVDLTLESINELLGWATGL